MTEAERRIAAALNAIDIHEMSHTQEMGTDPLDTLDIVAGFLRGDLPVPEGAFGRELSIRLCGNCGRELSERGLEWVCLPCEMPKEGN